MIYSLAHGHIWLVQNALLREIFITLPVLLLLILRSARFEILALAESRLQNRQLDVVASWLVKFEFDWVLALAIHSMLRRFDSLYDF